MHAQMKENEGSKAMHNELKALKSNPSAETHVLAREGLAKLRKTAYIHRSLRGSNG